MHPGSPHCRLGPSEPKVSLQNRNIGNGNFNAQQQYKVRILTQFVSHADPKITRSIPARTMAPPTPTEVQLLSIRNTISNYSIALDTKNFDLLHSVFSADMVADYSAVSPKNPTIKGLDDFMTRIKTILKGRSTQHALSTQRLTFEEHEGKVVCLAMTYFTANTFVTGEDGVLDHVSSSFKMRQDGWLIWVFR
jgi:hypothetical protein